MNQRSPLVGFNNNVKHKGRIFHIQTEDSGVKHPHIVTHLFADGGRIVKSQRTDYSEHLERSDLAMVLRSLMKEQHKAMFIALRDGTLDRLIADIFGEAPAEGRNPTSEISAKGSTEARGHAAPSSERRPSKRPSTRPSQRPSKRPSQRPGARAPRDSKRTSRAPRSTGVAPRIQPPPRVPAEFGVFASPPPTQPEGVPASRRTRVTTPLIGSTSGNGRYAPARPSHIFGGTSRRSLFGEAALSDTTLDEIILGYIAEGDVPREND